MKKKSVKLKRKLSESVPTTSKTKEEDEENAEITDSQDEVEFFNIVNDEDEDSSDSDQEIEGSNVKSDVLTSSDDESGDDNIDTNSEDDDNDFDGKDVTGEKEEKNSDGKNLQDTSDGEESAREDDLKDSDVEEDSDEEASGGDDTIISNVIKTQNKGKQKLKLQNVSVVSNKRCNVRKLNTTNDEKEKKLEPKEIFHGRKKKLNAVVKLSSQPHDEYADHDTSDEEDIRNTVGNVPMNWYDEYKHLGYNWDGKQIIKPETGDQIDHFLKRMDDPDFWRTVKDTQTGQDIVLSEEDIALIRRIQRQKIPDDSFDEYAPWIEWFTSEVMKTPIRKFPEHKRSFLPSKYEAKKVSKLVHALKMGWIKTKAEQDKLKAKKEPEFYMLWQTDDQPEEMRRIHKHIPAPKRHLPGHAESYNPPREYLFDSREMKQWEKSKDMQLKQKLHFLPQKYDSLRKVPAYSRYIKERFLRCLDLYLCPRAIKMKLTIAPEDLVPKLPSSRDLQPFPTVLSVQYEGHSDMVRSISTDKNGQYLASGSDDMTVKIWEINTGRCLKTIKTEGIVRSVQWCPNNAISLILVASGNRVLLVNPHVGDFLVNSKTDAVLKESPQEELIINERVRACVHWEEPTEEEYLQDIRLIIKHFKEVTQVTWHGRGDYFATVMPDGQNRSVLISQLSKRRSQLPFSKSKGLVQYVLFHPVRPLLFVATQRNIRIYDLVKQQLVKKLLTSSRWISAMDIHPGGDNLLVATYDRKIHWFDLDLSTKPYQTLRLHGTAVRGVAFHKRYPLFASASDDKSLIVSHGMVYNDLLQNPLIVPLKRFQDHASYNDFGIFDVKFHPLQPWVFTAGADGTVKLYSN